MTLRTIKQKSYRIIVSFQNHAYKHQQVRHHPVHNQTARGVAVVCSLVLEVSFELRILRLRHKNVSPSITIKSCNN